MAGPVQLQLGVSEFRRLREDELVYVDKSLLIRDVILDAATVLLLPRPRRFGKTTNLSMLRTFFARSPEPLWPLFEGLAIADAGDELRKHCQRYPTIALTFKDVTARTWTDCRAALAIVISQAYEEHAELLATGVLSAAEAESFREIQHGRASNAQLWASLGKLSMYLERHHGERVVILIDEYDTPLHASFVHRYYDDAVEFFRNFLSGGLKVRDERRGETVEQALDRALEQLATRDYAAKLRTRGATPVHELAVVFDGKRVFARAREL